MSLRVLGLASCVTALLITAARASATVLYTLTPVGTLGGNSFATGINSLGQVVGRANLPVAGYHAFVFDGTFHDLGTLGGIASEATGINDSGQIVGWSYLSGGTTTHAFVYSPGGAMTDLGTFGGTSSLSSAINNAGAIAGTYTTSAGYNHAYKYDHGVFTDLTPGANVTSYGNAIAGDGTVVGSMPSIALSGHEQAAIFSSPPVHLPFPSGTYGLTDSDATGVNDKGQVVGVASSAGYGEGFVYGMAGSPILHMSIASGINNNGAIVGQVSARAAIWDGGLPVDLNTLINPALGWTLGSASAINDNGQIAATGLGPDGRTEAVLLTPVPEPASVAVFILGAAMLVIRPRRRSAYAVKPQRNPPPTLRDARSFRMRSRNSWRLGPGALAALCSSVVRSSAAMGESTSGWFSR